jgi:hypothetical protein
VGTPAPTDAAAAPAAAVAEPALSAATLRLLLVDGAIVAGALVVLAALYFDLQGLAARRSDGWLALHFLVRAAVVAAAVRLLHSQVGIYAIDVSALIFLGGYLCLWQIVALADPRTRRKILRVLTSQWGLWLPLIAALLIWMLALAPPQPASYWNGATFLLAGALILAVALFLLFLFYSLWTSLPWPWLPTIFVVAAVAGLAWRAGG